MWDNLGIIAFFLFLSYIIIFIIGYILGKYNERFKPDDEIKSTYGQEPKKEKKKDKKKDKEYKKESDRDCFAFR